MTLEHIRIGAVLVVAIVAVGFDVRTRRIPNLLTFGAAILAMLVAILTGGLPATLTTVFAWMLGVALFLPFFALGGMGAGDVKLLAALAAWLGPEDAVYMAHVRVDGRRSDWPRGDVGPRLHPAGPVEYLADADALASRRTEAGAWTHVERRPAPRLAYAIPIAVGALCTLWRH